MSCAVYLLVGGVERSLILVIDELGRPALPGQASSPLLQDAARSHLTTSLVITKSRGSGALKSAPACSCPGTVTLRK